MRYFDLSQPLFDDCPNCPVHPPIRLPRTADHPNEGWRMEEFHMASHSGTHLDAPLHKLAGGKPIDAFGLEAFCAPAVVAEFPEAVPALALGPRELEKALPKDQDTAGSILLLNTGWGRRRSKTQEWLRESPFLSPSGADWVVAKGFRAVGIDHFSIGGMKEPDNARTHEILLGAGLWVVEELRFNDGWREFLPGALFQALPLLLPGFSGSPCRAVFLKP